jgi:hypothetical protein
MEDLVLAKHIPLNTFMPSTTLTPKDKGHFSQKSAQICLSSSRSPNSNLIIYLFEILIIRSCLRLLGEHVQNVS